MWISGFSTSHRQAACIELVTRLLLLLLLLLTNFDSSNPLFLHRIHACVYIYLYVLFKHSTPPLTFTICVIFQTNDVVRSRQYCVVFA